MYLLFPFSRSSREIQPFLLVSFNLAGSLDSRNSRVYLWYYYYSMSGEECGSAKSIVSCFPPPLGCSTFQAAQLVCVRVESVCVCPCCAKGKDKKQNKTTTSTRFSLCKRKREQLKANLISTPELNPDGMSRLDQFLFLIFCRLSFLLHLFPFFFLFKKKLLLTRSTGTIDPSLSFLCDCLQPFLVVYSPIDMLRPPIASCY